VNLRNLHEEKELLPDYVNKISSEEEMERTLNIHKLPEPEKINKKTAICSLLGGVTGSMIGTFFAGPVLGGLVGLTIGAAIERVTSPSLKSKKANRHQELFERMQRYTKTEVQSLYEHLGSAGYDLSELVVEIATAYSWNKRDHPYQDRATTFVKYTTGEIHFFGEDRPKSDATLNNCDTIGAFIADGNDKEGELLSGLLAEEFERTAEFTTDSESIVEEFFSNAERKVERGVLRCEDAAEAGSTGLAFVIGPDCTFYLGNVGDARAYLADCSKESQQKHPYLLTRDHNAGSTSDDCNPAYFDSCDEDTYLKSTLTNYFRDKQKPGFVERRVYEFPKKSMHRIQPGHVVALFSDGGYAAFTENRGDLMTCLRSDCRLVDIARSLLGSSGYVTKDDRTVILLRVSLPDYKK
jgi:serine/threonine protein phosphatase PrpC